MKRDLLRESLKNIEKMSEEREPPRQPQSVKAVAEVLKKATGDTIRSINPDDIRNSNAKDRFDVDEGLEDIISSIKASGQQIPALLRNTGDNETPYEVVYGRRRIAACRALGIDVKAYVRDITDRDALLTQALENSARKDISFIESAVFAEELKAHGLSADEIAKAMAKHPSEISRMKQITDNVPQNIIAAIGSANGSGRRVWTILKDLLGHKRCPGDDEVCRLIPSDGTSDEKLNGLIAQLENVTSDRSKTSRNSTKPSTSRKVPGSGITVRSSDSGMQIKINKDADIGFSAFLNEHIDELYSKWKNQE